MGRSFSGRTRDCLSWSAGSIPAWLAILSRFGVNGSTLLLYGRGGGSIPLSGSISNFHRVVKDGVLMKMLPSNKWKFTGLKIRGSGFDHLGKHQKSSGTSTMASVPGFHPVGSEFESPVPLQFRAMVV